MKKFTIWQLVVAFLFVSNFSYSQIISQYVETNSGTTPKGIEIWNNTAGVLDFSTNNLEIKKGTNGAAPATDVTISSGTLAVGAVLVIGTADMEATTVGNGAAFTTYAFSFNGDDALEVWYGATKTDVFGDPGNDPGSAWAGNGVESRNQNIQLLAGISTGDLDGWTDPSTRFETISTTPATLPAGIEGFGIAPAGGAPPAVPAPSFSPSAGTYYSAIDVTMTVPSKDASNEIYYTTDGTDPDNTSTLYTGTIMGLNTNTDYKAITFDGSEYSSITSASYVFETPVEVADIATLRAGSKTSTVYHLTGEAVLIYDRNNARHQKFIRDNTAAIMIDDPAGNITTSYNLGDGITGLLGTLTEYAGLLEFTPIADPGAATSTGNNLDPIHLTATDFVANFENYESNLVKVTRLTFADAGGTFSQYTVYPTTNNLGDPVTVRTNFNEADYIGSAIPTGENDVVGIAYQYNDAGALTPRFATDFIVHEVPMSSWGILIAGLLIGLFVFVRRGRLF